jgi:hypothetical protein
LSGSTSSGVKRIGAITALVVVGLLGVLAGVRQPAAWPEPETPPQQGEAVEPGSISTRPVHSAVALARLVREPQNTWSNLAFVIGGAFLAGTATSRLSRLVGVAVIAVGVGSFLYHASASRELRHLDVAAMYWLFLMTTALCIGAVWPPWRAKLEAVAVAVFGVALIAAVLLTFARNVTVFGIKPFSLHAATAVTAAILILSLAQVARRLETIGAALQLLGIVTVFGVAVACQTSDRPGRRFYRPDAIIQAHAVWHVLAAGTLVAAVKLLERDAGADGAPRMDVSSAS